MNTNFVQVHTNKAITGHLLSFSPCLQYSRCSSSMMVKLANDGLLPTDGKMLVDDGEMLCYKIYDHTLISPSLTSIPPSLTNILPLLCSLKYIIFRSFDHHGEAAPTAICLRLKKRNPQLVSYICTFSTYFHYVISWYCRSMVVSAKSALLLFF